MPGRGIQVQPCPGSRCCRPKCTIDADDFDRDDEDPVVGWNTPSGIWNVDNQRLEGASDFSSAQIDRAHPDGNPTGVVSARIMGGAGSQARLILDALPDDNDNYHFAEYEFPIGGLDFKGCLSIGKREGGGETILTKTDVLGEPDTWHSMIFTYDGVTLTVEFFGDASATICYDDLPLGGQRAGVAIGETSLGSNFVYFDDFVYSRIAEPDTRYADCPSPPECGCGLSSDDFDHAFGCRYEQTGGAWFEGVGEAHPPGANATLMLETPSPTGAVKIETSVKGATDDVVKIIVGDDGSTHWYAQLTFGASKTLKIFTSGGAELASMAVSTTANTYIDFDVCFADGLLIANVNGNILPANITVPTVECRCGIGTGGTAATVRWDFFNASRANEDCPKCEVPCACCPDDLASTTIILDMTGHPWEANPAQGNCADCVLLSDLFILKWVSNCTWRYYFDDEICNGIPYIEMTLGCDETGTSVGEIVFPYNAPLEVHGMRIGHKTPPAVVAIDLETCFSIEWPGRPHDGQTFSSSSVCFWNHTGFPSHVSGLTIPFAFGP